MFDRVKKKREKSKDLTCGRGFVLLFLIQVNFETKSRLKWTDYEGSVYEQKKGRLAHNTRSPSH
jgi:beta-xylosidase